MKQGPVKITAKILSYIFNPFLIPIIGYLLIYSHIPGTEYYTIKVRNILFMVYLISTCVLPLLFIAVLLLNKEKQRNLDNRTDRIVPYMFTAFSIFMGSQLVGKLPVPGIFRIFLLGISILVVLSLIITLRWKISGHASALGGLLGVLLGLNFSYGMNFLWVIIAVVIVSGLVGTSRVYLHKHTPSQVYAGFLMGLACMFSVLYII
jgi:membrane-associated phospholipid phosphatase